MKILTTASLLVLGLAWAFTVGAATPAAEPAPEIGAPEMTQAAVEGEPSEADEKPLMHCPDSTATRIKRPRQRCTSPGRVYTAEDIRSTGATNIGDALDLLDPAISVRRY